MRALAACAFIALLTSSSLAVDFNVGGESRGECDNRREPNAQKCVYFGNPYFDTATGTFSSNINPHYDPITGTFSSRAPQFAMAKSAPRVVRRHHR